VLITAIFDEHGELRGFTKVTRDMTERKLADEQREQLREREYQLLHERDARAQMEEAVHMRDTFLSLLGHELRTPLTTLLGNAQLLLRRAQREGVLPEREQRNLQVIADQAARLNKLVQLQLDISRLQTGQLHIERTPLDVGALTRRVVEEALPTVTTHTIAYSAPARPLLVLGDELRLDQVLQNLLQNAMKYSPEGSTVHIGVEQHDTMVCVTVRDEGIGIPQADLPHLFQRFYRASNVDERQIIGLGLGLYVIKELVTLHDGTVDVASEEGRGSTFTICLPLARNAPGANPDTVMPEQ
jgi:signal transduction histidine kinase